MLKKIYDITNYGAKANVDTLQTEKIQKAIDECFLQGGGTIKVPKGVYLTGGIRLRSNCHLHLESGATLKGSRNPEDYFSYLHDETEPILDNEITDKPWTPCEAAWGGRDIEKIKSRDYTFMRVAGGRWNNALIRAINAENISITGEKDSYLDGSDCFDEIGEERYRGPHCINLHNCKNVSLSGYTVKDSANWAHAVFFSKNIEVENVCILAGHDGVHVTGCENVNIKNCEFFTGDDCVAGIANTNVLVEGCTLNSACSALRFGGTNVFVTKCNIYGPCKYLFRGSLSDEEKRSGAKPKLEGHRNNMLSAFTYYSDYSVDIPNEPGNIVISDCTIKGADKLVHYNFSGTEWWQTNKPLPSLALENLKVEGMVMPSILYGDEDKKINFSLKRCVLSAAKGYETVDVFQVANYENILIEDVEFTNYKGVIIKTWSDGKIFFKNVKAASKEENLIVSADTDFGCESI